MHLLLYLDLSKINNQWKINKYIHLSKSIEKTMIVVPSDIDKYPKTYQKPMENQSLHKAIKSY